MMRWDLRILLVLTVIIGILVIGGYFYLHSQKVREQVRAKLEAAYGGPVQIADVDVGLSSSSVTGVKLYEKGKDATKKPWASAETLQTDVSILDMIEGTSTPHQITLTGASVRLRFDQHAKLSSDLPSTIGPLKLDRLPNVRLVDGQIALEREGGGEMVISNVNANLRREGDRFLLEGSAGSAASQGWGRWTMHGSFKTSDETIGLTLQAEQPVHVTQAMLDDLPFVAPSVWKEVMVEGTTPARVTLQIDLKDRKPHYRVELEPFDTTVHVPAIELVGTGAHGKLVLDGDAITLRDVQGQAFGGSIRTNGTIDFAGRYTDLKFSPVEVKGMDTAQVPTCWGLPPRIQGMFSGRAWLEVVLEEGKPLTRGEGVGRIDNARGAGLPTVEPVTVELNARDGGFAFRTKPGTTGGKKAKIGPK